MRGAHPGRRNARVGAPEVPVRFTAAAGGNRRNMEIRRLLAALMTAVALFGGGATLTACSSSGQNANDGTTDDSSNTAGRRKARPACPWPTKANGSPRRRPTRTSRPTAADGRPTVERSALALGDPEPVQPSRGAQQLGERR